MNKRLILSALAVAAAVFATSCAKEEPIDPQEKPEVEVEVKGLVFEAKHEVLTKSTLVDLTPTWVEGDEIYVSGEKGGVKCTFS